jgi:glucoamylase
MYKHLLNALAVAGLWLDGAAARRLACRDDLSTFISKQNDISLQGVLANIGSDGSRAQGASPGVVVASPSTTDPDCMSRLVPDPFTCLLFETNIIKQTGTHGAETLP